MNLKETYNKIAEDWVKDHDKDTWWQEGTDHFLSLLPKGASVLDVGCGGGIKTNYIKEKGFEAMGIDFSEKMIEIAQRTYPDIEFAIVDVEQIDIVEKNFDAIFVQAVLLHVQKNKIREVLERMKNKLIQNGLLYIAVKSIRSDGVEEKIQTKNDYGYEYERFFSYYSLDELKQCFKELSMEVLWESGLGLNNTNWIQIIGKK